jgi:hypothetical protein
MIPYINSDLLFVVIKSRLEDTVFFNKRKAILVEKAVCLIPMPNRVVWQCCGAWSVMRPSATEKTQTRAGFDV